MKAHAHQLLPISLSISLMGEDKCDTALGLAIGHGEDSTAGKGGGRRRRREPEPAPKVRLHLWFSSSTTGEDDDEEEENNQPSMESENSEKKFPNTKNKSDEGGDEGGARKKLRLSPEQSALLEDNFRAHNTLTSLQKEELARKLGLRPRQVEVWFQNRRARIKLKQTEVECEVLKGWCESLSEENRRLRKEMQELRFSASCWSPCPSHSKENGGGGGGRGHAGGDLGKEAGNLQLCSTTTYLCK